MIAQIHIPFCARKLNNFAIHGRANADLSRKSYDRFDARKLNRLRRTSPPSCARKLDNFVIRDRANADFSRRMYIPSCARRKLVIRHSSLVIRRSSFVIRHSSLRNSMSGPACGDTVAASSPTGTLATQWAGSI